MGFKAGGLMAASVGLFGTARAQAHLRRIFATPNMYPLNRPQVLISNSVEKFDANGNVTDEATKAKNKRINADLGCMGN